MAEIIEMPKMSDTMTEGVLVNWLKKEGDAVKSGEILAEVETDKATMELESYFNGTLLHIAAPAGSAVPVGALIAIVGKAGEDVSGIIAQYKNKGAAAAPAAAATPEPVATPVVTAPAVSTTPAAPVRMPEPTNLAPGALSPRSGYAPILDAVTSSKVSASPLARVIAAEKGIDLKQVQGTGENGRIVKKDLENAKAAPAAKGATAPAAAQYEEVVVSQMRKTIARRLGESKFTAPHFYLTMPIHMDKAAAFRKMLNEEEKDVKISFNDIVVKACAVALRKHPKVNSSWLGDTIRFHKQVNVGVAVAVEEGLLVPVIRNADAKGLKEISLETRELAGKARNKQLQPSDWEGNTFTISNLGMYGIEEFTAIINPPDACILAVGAILEQPVVVDGAIRVGQVMRVTLSCDHRVVDGAVGSEFLQTLKYLLENPMRMLL